MSTSTRKPKLETLSLSARRVVKICERVRALDRSQSWEDCAALLGISPQTLRTLRKNAAAQPARDRGNVPPRGNVNAQD